MQYHLLANSNKTKLVVRLRSPAIIILIMAKVKEDTDKSKQADQ
jgi:hypothetical protein